MADEVNEITLLNELNETKAMSELDNLATGNPMVPAFFAEWLKNGQNAGLAYRTLRPTVSEPSSRVLGCKLLTKINKSALLSSMGFDVAEFMKALYDGLQAVRQNQITGETFPDFRTRLEYLKLAGKLLGIIQN